jgi:Neuraminidase (sialidase)
MAIWNTGEDAPSESLTGLGTDSDVVYAISTDNGATFSSPKIIHASAMSDAINVRDRMPDIAMTESTWTAVWATEQDLTGGSGTDEDIVYSFSQDKGNTWSDPAYLNSWAASDNKTDYFPQIAMNGTGFAVTIWAGYGDGISLDIYAATSTDFGKTWNSPKLINQYAAVSVSDQDYPSHIEVTEDNIAVISWDGANSLHGSDDDAYFSVSTDLGENWSTEVAMNLDAETDSNHDNDLSIQQTQSGSWIAVYSDVSDGISYMRKSDDLENWSDPVSINDDSYENTTLLLH